MEGYSVINYKNKQIHIVDYSVLNKSKEKTIKLIQYATEQYKNLPKDSVLAIVNAENFYFDMDILKVFKEEGAKTAPYEKKVAVIGVKGLIKAAYNFVVGLTRNNYKVMNSEAEAKEWLIKD